VAGVAAILLLTSAPARADNAFPNSESIMTPEDRPQDFLLVTNFGLITSTDGGATWLWSCEQDRNALGTAYQLTPAPRNRLIAVANQNVVTSDDRACGWQIASGAIAGQSMTDAYLDPVSGTRVLAIGVASQVYSLFPSSDAGTTFAAALYQAPAGTTMNSVEIAQSDGNVTYLAMRSSAGAPLLARSSDGGAHFTVSDLSATLGTGLLRIIAIDPQDPNRVLMRFLSPNDESIALTVDGGLTATKPVTVSGSFNAYVRLPSSGTILIAGVVDGNSVPGLYRSHDRGATFERVANPPVINALSQRSGKLYAAADNFADGFAIGVSTDEGTTWQSVLVYTSVAAINPCLKAQCQETCTNEVSLSLWSDAVCSADPPGATGAAGSGGGTGAAGQGGNAGGGGAGGSGTGGNPPPKHSGGCAIAGTREDAAKFSPLVIVGLLAWRARRARRGST